jgi:hypothetical protein
MEITLTELALFVWAAIATGFAYKFKEEKEQAGFILTKVLQDEDIRNDMVGKYTKWKEARDGR